MKVLIIDSDWRFARQVAEFLESHAHLVVHQTDPMRAVAQVHSWRPELVILAAEHAENGLIEPLTACGNRPAILLTESMDRYDRAWRAWQIGGDELLMKPVFATDEICDAIITALENAAAGSRRSAPAVA